MLIAACDTFRSGAVEQLQTHAVRLGVQVFDQGYAKDPSAVARAAIACVSRLFCSRGHPVRRRLLTFRVVRSKATAEHIDVVLVDTAGRMQNNTSLMKALAKLVFDNRPDLVLFVGEALVGNDGVDQLMEFNGVRWRPVTRCLPFPPPRLCLPALPRALPRVRLRARACPSLLERAWRAAHRVPRRVPSRILGVWTRAGMRSAHAPRAWPAARLAAPWFALFCAFPCLASPSPSQSRFLARACPVDAAPPNVR